MGALKKLLRLIFLADAPISVAYPLRMGIYKKVAKKAPLSKAGKN
jgi:hypothetical protein